MRILQWAQTPYQRPLEVPIGRLVQVSGRRTSCRGRYGRAERSFCDNLAIADPTPWPTTSAIDYREYLSVCRRKSQKTKHVRCPS
jgi:hypothetical protein